MTRSAADNKHALKQLPATERRAQPLRTCIRTALEIYFQDLNGHKPGDLYHMVLNEVEEPLLQSVLQYVHGNQTKAAEILGINSSTLRKKLRQYGLDT